MSLQSGKSNDIAADPLRDREIPFSYGTSSYKAKFKKESGWTIFNWNGIICPEKSNPTLWFHFKKSVQPNETKALSEFTGLAKEENDPRDQDGEARATATQLGFKGTKKMSLADLHSKIINNRLTDEERRLVARIVKEIALNKMYHVNGEVIITSSGLSVELSDKYSPDDF